VSTHIGDRDLEGSVNWCNGNRDIPIRDFLTCLWSVGHRGTGKWTGGAVSEIRCVGYRRLEIPIVDVANSDFPIGRSFDSGGEVNVDSYRVSGNREVRNTRP
jgi:hypothetical protein